MIHINGQTFLTSCKSVLNDVVNGNTVKRRYTIEIRQQIMPIKRSLVPTSLELDRSRVLCSRPSLNRIFIIFD